MKTIAQFAIGYEQLLDAEGKVCGELPPFASDAEDMRRMYCMMVLCRVFDTKAINLQRTGRLGTYAPWAVDILPLPTWIQLGVALSVLFSGMAFGHRFNLWRIDAQRVRIEREIPALFHPGVTVGEIAEMQPDAARHEPQTRARLDDLLARLETLAERCRRKSLSILVPMGEEMSYRYQETLIAELQYALRLYRDRLPRTT